MTKRMDPIEKLARRICWLEFSPPRNRNGTEKTYWEGVADFVKRERIAETRRFLWQLEALYDSVSNINLVEKARDEYDALHERGKR